MIYSKTDLNKYKIGAIRDDVGEQLLIEAGVGKNNIEPVSEALSNIKKLNKNRIDAWAYGEPVANWFIKKNGYNVDDYETVYILKEADLYYAFHKDTPVSLIDKFQNALDQLKKKTNKNQSEYDNILNYYLK